MIVNTQVVPRGQLYLLKDKLEEDLELYRTKTPHPIGSNEELWANWLSPNGDEVFVYGVNREYAGFLTFKVQQLPGLDEIWGTISILLVREGFQGGDVLGQIGEQLSAVMRERGCTVMNYMTARKGFKRLAPRLGFQQRIIEWMKEL